MRFSSRTLQRTACAACCLLLLACNPKYNWREVPGTAAPYVVALPAKPATHARQIDLDGILLTMTMTGAEVDNVTFAVGTAELPDAAQASGALGAMRTALVRNIGGTIRQEQRSEPGVVPTMIEIEASAAMPGDTRLLLARFIARDRHVYQLVVTGRESDLSREAADTFFTSFRLP
jgi:hypothetical protein